MGSQQIAVATRGGMETLRPALQRVYMTRASAYRDALKSFIEGYQEGIQQIMEKKEDFDSPPKEKTPSKPTRCLLMRDVPSPEIELLTQVVHIHLKVQVIGNFFW